MGTSPYACCAEGCLIFGDDFNRANGTNLGCGWDEITGNSAIDTNELSIPTGGKVRCTVPHPIANTPTCFVTVKLTTIAEGSIYQVRVNANEDGTGGEIVEFEITATSSFLRTATEELETGGVSGWDDVTLTVCRNLEGIYAQINEVVGIEYECLGEGSGGRYVTLANGGGTTTWDDFEYEEHDITNQDCYPCPCDCGYHCTPKELTLTITVTNPELCGCVDGFSCTLTQLEGGGLPYGHPAHLAWEWTGTRDDWDCIYIPQELGWKYRLECTFADPDCPGDSPSWKLTGCVDGSNVVGQCGVDNDPEEPYAWKPADGEGGYLCSIACAIEVICHPFYLKYGEPFHCEKLAPGPTPSVCEYIIEITEA